MTYYKFVERGYPILDSGGSFVDFFLGSREEAEGYATMLGSLSKREAVVEEEYHVGKSISVYTVNENGI